MKDKKGLISAIIGTAGIIAASLAAGKLFSGEKKDENKQTGEDKK